MTPDRKHPSAALWITVALVAVLVGYPLSFGPWLWIDWSIDVPFEIETAAYYFYWPCYQQFRCTAVPEWYGRYCDWFHTNALNCPSYLRR